VLKRLGRHQLRQQMPNKPVLNDQFGNDVHDGSVSQACSARS
jgi:hypothetical protein